jgi:dienelactone hydrolase
LRLYLASLVVGLILCPTIAARDEWQDTRIQIERTLHVSRPLPNLQAKTYGKIAVVPDVEAERVSYSTAYDLRVPALVYREKGPTIAKHPALVIVNGHNGDKSSWYAYWAGILYARAGAVVLTYDPIGEFERNRNRQSKSSQHDSYIAPDDVSRRLSGLMITDTMQAVSYLSSRSDVDPKRIAVLGYSMGSFVSSLACALDTRVKACILAAGGDLDGPDGYWDKSNKMCQGIPYKSLAFLGDRGAAIYALNAKRGPTLVMNGEKDDVVDIVHHGRDWFEQLRARTIQRLGSTKNVFEVKFEADAGHRPYFLTKEVALWLQEVLNLPNWKKKQIVQMPQTQIDEWALRGGFVTDITTSYKLHEGGTLALGNGIPVVPRDQLHAIPEAVWDSQASDYIYETWVERAQAAIRSEAP